MFDIAEADRELLQQPIDHSSDRYGLVCIVASLQRDTIMRESTSFELVPKMSFEYWSQVVLPLCEYHNDWMIREYL